MEQLSNLEALNASYPEPLFKNLSRETVSFPANLLRTSKQCFLEEKKKVFLQFFSIRDPATLV